MKGNLHWGVWCAAACVASTWLVSCAGTGGDGLGGGDGGGGVNGPLGCSLDSYLPNYLKATDPSTGEKNSVHWWDHFPLRVYFQNNPTIQGQSLTAVSMAGFNEWSDVAGKAVAIQVSNSDDADVIVAFELVSGPPQGDDWVGATSWSYNPSTFETIEADMTLRVWNGMTSNQVSNGLRGTAQHEFGHAIFLSGHSPYSSDSMYPFGSISTYTPITTRDANSLLTTYCGSFQDRATTHRSGDRLATKWIECPAK